jgi:hypothetical protein
MVNNGENILVEFDYQNITVIDPNKLVDNNGKVSERLINHEDLIMYANLECNVVPRTKLAVGVPLDESLKTISVGKINFLNPGFKTFLDDAYTDEITGKNTLQGRGVNQVNSNVKYAPNKSDNYYVQQTLTSDGQPGAVDNGLLGITDISITYGTDFLPVIDVTLEDVKGRALFEGGNNSPYAAFFQLPYPIFYLTIKGYLGKAVRIPLMLYTFTSSYDSSSGNFRVQLKFYSYKYSILSYIPWGGMLAVPFMYRSVIETKNETQTNQTSSVTLDRSFSSGGYQKMKELYSEYKSKGLIDENFPELTIQQLQRRLNIFLKTIYESFKKTNMNILNDIDDFEKNLELYRSEVVTYTDSWVKTFLDEKNPYTDTLGRLNYLYKKELINIFDADVRLKALVLKYNKLLENNKTLGKNTKNSVPIDIVCNSTSFCIFISSVKSTSDLDLKKTYFQRTGNEYPIGNQQITSGFEVQIGKEINGKDLYFYEGKDSFIEKINKIKEDFLKQKKTIEDELTKDLSNRISGSVADGGIGFEPTIRNVLAVFFAQGEALLRLMDDVHTKAWNVREDRFRKGAIFNNSTASSVDVKDLPESQTPVYPWPQIINKNDTKKDGEKYELVYPGDDAVATSLNAFNPEIWPEVEFIEEFISGYSTRETQIPEPETISNSLVNPKRLSLNSIEFPIGNDVFANTEEVKFFYEMYERLLINSFYERMNRDGVYQYNIPFYVAEMERLNIVEALGDDNPYLSNKLKEYDLSDFLSFLRDISNQGQGPSWQNYIRGEFNTPYIKNDTKKTFEIFNVEILDNNESKPSLSVDNSDLITKYFSKNVVVENFDFPDIYPLTNIGWIQNYMAGGSVINFPIDTFITANVLNYNEVYKSVTNFEQGSAVLKLPISNFNYEPTTFSQTLNLTNLKTFYESRSFNKQYITEGNLNYINYTNNLTAAQTTSILNTPYFVNAIQKGVYEFRYNSFNQYPYKEAAYLFLSSLPLTTTVERYKTYDNGVIKELDYVLATLKKYGAIHKLPYSWILKYGGVWHRYKTWIETGVDFLQDIWGDFNYEGNYDPITSAVTKNYDLIIDGSPYKFVLQEDLTVGPLSKTVMNTGFYPKTLDDFNVFYQGTRVFDSTYEVSGTCKVSATTNILEIVSITSPDLITGSILSGPNIILGTTILSQISGTTGGAGKYLISETYPTGLSLTDFKLANVENIDYSSGDIQAAINDGSLYLNFDNNTVLTKLNGFDPLSSNRSLMLKSWSCYAPVQDEEFIFPLPSFGAPTNQVGQECFNNIGNLKTELKNNPALFNGSIRSFWKAPNYGYFDDQKVSIPSPDAYLKNVLSELPTQENFSINGKSSNYSKIDDMFSAFDKDVLDTLEKEFLLFSKSVYDYETTLSPKNEELQSQKDFKNFQALMRLLMKIPKPTKTTASEIIQEVQENQITNFQSNFKNFMEYQVVLKYGNPSNFNKRLFYTFSNDFIQDPYSYNYYKTNSPNALPSSSNTITLANSKLQYPNTWKTLETYVGFSEITLLRYSDSGSYITDFFIDINVEFSEQNVINFAPIIKIYATQKLQDPSLNRTKFFTLMSNYITKSETYINTVLGLELTTVRKNLKSVTIKKESKKVKADLDGEQTRYELYDMFKGLNDTWIAGGDYKTKTLFEDVLLFDRASRDVGQKIYVDVFKAKDTIDYGSYKNKMIDIVSTIITENNFTFFTLPAYANFYNVQDASKNPTPAPEGSLEFANTLFGTFATLDYRETSSKFLCLYASKPSEHLALNENVDYRFRDDAFDLRRASDCPLVEDQDGKQDWDRSNKVVGFNVDMGPQNQQIFKRFDVSQEPGDPTTESLEMLNQMANLNRNRAGASQSASLYNVYRNRSYKCSVDMLGNAMIQPMMYFNLRYVPMFSGPYMITKVTHKINDSGFDTTFEGQRQPFYSIPALDKYLQSLSTKILTSLRQKIQEEDNRLSETPENVKTEVNSSVSYATSGIGTVSTQSCSANLIRSYQDYVNITPTEMTTTFKNLYDLLTQKIKSQGLDSERSGLLRAFIFSTIYIGSFNSQNFKSVENNYAAIPLNIDWGGSATYFDSEYFCVDQGTNLKVPMAKFSNLEKFLDFMINKYTGKLGSIESYLDKTATTDAQIKTTIINAVTKTYIIDFPKNKSTKVYDEMIESDKEKIKEKITKSYNLLESL